MKPDYRQTNFPCQPCCEQTARIGFQENGRGGRARTDDLRFWRPPLYQLSYTPKPSFEPAPKRCPSRTCALFKVMSRRWQVGFCMRCDTFMDERWKDGLTLRFRGLVTECTFAIFACAGRIFKCAAGFRRIAAHLGQLFETDTTAIRTTIARPALASTALAGRPFRTTRLGRLWKNHECRENRSRNNEIPNQREPPLPDRITKRKRPRCHQRGLLYSIRRSLRR